MKKSKNVRKLNNQGMSLIEILVAMIILGVVTASLLHSFVTSVRLNAKAKEKQRVATAAQSLMEGLKAYDMEHICLQFNGGGMRLISNADTYYEEALSDRDGDGVSDVSIVLDGDGGYTFLPAADNKYAFVLENIKFDNIDGMEDQYYDARIEISQNTVWNASMSADEKSLIDVVDINEYLDAVYKQPRANMDQSVYAQIMQDILDELNGTEDAGDGGDGSEEDEEDDDGLYDLHDLETMGSLEVRKTTTVTITEESPDPAVALKINKVTVETKYEYVYTYTDKDGHSGEISHSKWIAENVMYGEETPLQDKVYKIYDSTETAAFGAHLENVYLYYYPAYPLNGMNFAREEIVLKNETASEKNIYLIKQVNSSLSHATLMAFDAGYTPDVMGGSLIQLYHNLGENLASPGSPSSAPSIIGIPVGNVHTEMVTSTEKVLLYNVKISIYESGAAHPDGGDPFPEEMRLLELNGSMNN